ncbi:hypothetical protein DSECCO2_462250 [anaerobic digester metagenome]
MFSLWNCCHGVILPELKYGPGYLNQPVHCGRDCLRLLHRIRDPGCHVCAGILPSPHCASQAVSRCSCIFLRPCRSVLWLSKPCDDDSSDRGSAGTCNGRSSGSGCSSSCTSVHGNRSSNPSSKLSRASSMKGSNHSTRVSAIRHIQVHRCSGLPAS